MALAASAGSTWAQQAQAPGKESLPPVEIPFLQQPYQRSYSWVAAGDAVPQAGKTSFVLDQWGEEVYLPETYQTKYKYDLVLTAINGSGRSTNWIGFQIQSSAFAGKPWFAAWCKSGSLRHGLLDAATDANFAALENVSDTEALTANAACSCSSTQLKCTVYGDGGREFDSGNWGSELAWKANVRDQNNVGADFVEVSSYGSYTWAGATALFATATTLYAASTMTF